MAVRMLQLGCRHGDPVSHCFQSDGWSSLVQERQGKQTELGGVYRWGTVKKEFLNEVSIIKTIDPHCRIASKIVVSPARPLDLGQGCWHIWQSSVQHFPLLRKVGFKGPQVFLALQDGLHWEGFGKHHAAYHELYYESGLCDGDEEERFCLESTDWCFSWRCVAHVGSSGIKWGMSRHSCEEVMKKIHVATRSLCSTSYTLRQHAPRFLVSHVVWVEEHELPCWTWREKYWRALGVDEDMLKEFQLANPVWDPPSKTFRVLRRVFETTLRGWISLRKS